MSDPGHSPTRAFGTQPAQWGPPDAAAAWQPPERRRREHPILSAILVVAVVAALMVVPAVAGRPDDGRRASAAMAYVPASGTRVVLQGSDGVDQVDEYYTTVGISITQSGPAAVGYAGTGGLEEFSTTTWLRVSSVVADAQARISDRNTQVYAATASGLELRVAAWPDRFLAFRPGLLVLPSEVSDGQSWSVAGTATIGTGSTPTGELPYAAQFRATAGDPGCVAVALTLSVGSGDDPTASTSSTTWCAGRGMTAGSDDTRTLTAVSRAPVWQRLGRAVSAQPRIIGPRGDPTRQDMNGLPPMAITPRLPPVVLPGPVLVYANNVGGDLVARGWSDGTSNARWAAHPGGAVTGLIAIGRVVVAATTERALVAYGDQGEFLWQAPLPDASQVPPVALAGPRSLVVVATLDGGVHAYEAETGVLAWEQRLPNEIRLPMQVTDAGVTVLDQAGNLRIFAADGTVVHELSVDPPESFAVAGELSVVASRMDGIVRAYRLADNTLAWRSPVAGSRIAIRPVGDVAVIQRGDDLTALRTADGTLAWTRSMRATTSAVRGSTLLVTDRTTLYQLDTRGASIGAWPTQEADLESSNALGLDQTTSDLFLFYSAAAYRWEQP